MSAAHQGRMHEVCEAACGRPAADEGVRCPTFVRGCRMQTADFTFIVEMSYNQAEECMKGTSC